MSLSPEEQDAADNEAQAIGVRVDEMMADAVKVAEWLDQEAIGSCDLNSDGNTHFSADLAAIMRAPESDWDALAHAWLFRLQGQLRENLTGEAESQFQADRDNDHDGEGDSDAR